MRASAGAALFMTLILGNGPAPDAIRARVLAFYRDDRAHRWPDLLEHFTVGKIAARWPAPSGDPAWTRAAPPDGSVPCSSSRGDVPFRMSIGVVGRWARVFVTWCDTGSTDEVWLLRIAEEWRIARLTRDVTRFSTYDRRGDPVATPATAGPRGRAPRR